MDLGGYGLMGLLSPSHNRLSHSRHRLITAFLAAVSRCFQPLMGSSSSSLTSPSAVFPSHFIIVHPRLCYYIRRFFTPRYSTAFKDDFTTICSHHEGTFTILHPNLIEPYDQELPLQPSLWPYFTMHRRYSTLFVSPPLILSPCHRL